jgi:mRNA interferase MazF
MLRRGDVALAFYPFASGTGGSRRPVLVVQGDAYNARIRNIIVAQITSNLSHGSGPAHLLIEVATPEGQTSGLLHDSVVSCLNLVTLTQDRIDRTIGRLSDEQMRQIDTCLKAALGIA